MNNPDNKLKYTELDDANSPILHFERSAGRLAYEITSTQNYICVFDAEDCTFETHGGDIPRK